MNIYDENHILNIAKNKNNIYFTEYLRTTKIIKNCISEKDFDDLIKNKLQINQNFNENSYLQNAVETTINSYFTEKYPKSFKYEVPSYSTKENVDCQVEYKGYIYNIEIKCPNLVKKENDVFYAGFGARTSKEGKNMVEEEIQNLANQLKGKKEVIFPWEVGGITSKDNTLANYLEKTQSKVGLKNDLKMINILVVSLYSSFSFSEWIKYLYMDQGLFRENTYKSSELYNEVDFVVFTSLVNSHKNWESSGVNPWKFEEQFNLVFINPYSNKGKEPGLSYFYNEIMPKHFSRQYEIFWFNDKKKYLEEKERIVSKFICNEISKKYNLPKVLRSEYIKKYYFSIYNEFYSATIKFGGYNVLCSEIELLQTIENMTLPTRFYRSLNLNIFINESEYIYVKER